MPDRSRCPNCGEHVSPYAAGCAVCGTEVDFRRWDAGPSRLARAGSWLSALTYGGRQERVHPLILWGLLLFGGSAVVAAIGLLSGLFG